MKTETPLRPLYRNNISYNRKMDIYRVSFLMSRKRATLFAIRKAIRKGIELSREGYFFTNDYNELSAVIKDWIMRNKFFRD